MRERRTEGKSRKRRFGARLMAVILAAGIAAAAAAGCGVKQEEPDDGRLKIVTTIFPQYDFVRAIAGDTGAVSVRMLLSPGEEVHSYEPTPLDIKEIHSRTWGTRDPRRCGWWISQRQWKKNPWKA